MFLGREAFEDTASYLKRLANASFEWFQALRMYGSLGMSVPTLVLVYRLSDKSMMSHLEYVTSLLNHVATSKDIDVGK